MNDIRQSKEYAMYMKSVGWEVERIGKGYAYKRRIPFAGTFIKVQRPAKINTSEVKNLIENVQPFQIIVEPQNQKDANKLEEIGLKLTKHPYVPSQTILLDLSLSKENILKQMKKDARASIKKTSTIKLLNTSPDKFRSSWRASVPLKRYVMSTSDLIAMKEAFGDSCLFLMTKTGGSGGLFLVSNGTGYYWQGFTNSNERKTLAQYQIVWQGILWAKKRGAKVFDFEGIYDERFPTSSWKGFSAFKKKFGGSVSEYPGAYRKTFIKNWRLLKKRLAAI